VGQTSAFAALSAGSQIGVILYPKSTLLADAGMAWRGQAVMTGWDVESPLDGAAGLKISLKGTGAITKAAAT
jgi:hypothetical protein